LLIIAKKLRQWFTAGGSTKEQVGESGLSPERLMKKTRSGRTVKSTEEVMGAK